MDEELNVQEQSGGQSTVQTSTATLTYTNTRTNTFTNPFDVPTATYTDDQGEIHTTTQTLTPIVIGGETPKQGYSALFKGVDLSLLKSKYKTYLNIVEPTQDDTGGVVEHQVLSNSGAFSYNATIMSENTETPAVMGPMVDVSMYKLNDQNLTSFGDIIETITNVIKSVNTVNQEIFNLKVALNNVGSSLSGQGTEAGAGLDAIVSYIAQATGYGKSTTSEFGKLLQQYSALTGNIEQLNVHQVSEWDAASLTDKLHTIMQMLEVVLNNDNTYDYTIVTEENQNNPDSHASEHGRPTDIIPDVTEPVSGSPTEPETGVQTPGVSGGPVTQPVTP